MTNATWHSDDAANAILWDSDLRWPFYHNCSCGWNRVERSELDGVVCWLAWQEYILAETSYRDIIDLVSGDSWGRTIEVEHIIAIFVLNKDVNKWITSVHCDWILYVVNGELKVTSGSLEIIENDSDGSVIDEAWDVIKTLSWLTIEENRGLRWCDLVRECELEFVTL